MKALIVIFSLSIVLTSTMTANFRAAQLDRIEPSKQWTDSVNDGKGADSPRIFSVIGGVQKMLDDRNIGINLLGGRYELCYKRIY